MSEEEGKIRSVFTIVVGLIILGLTGNVVFVLITMVLIYNLLSLE